MMTLSYLFTYADSQNLIDYLYDYKFQIDIMFAYKNKQIYIPYLSHHDNINTKVYYNIHINYETYDDIYEFLDYFIKLHDFKSLKIAEIKDKIIKDVNFTKEYFISNLNDLNTEKQFDYYDLEQDDTLKFKQDYIQLNVIIFIH